MYLIIFLVNFVCLKKDMAIVLEKTITLILESIEQKIPL